jgi:hypothetical protein
MKLWILSASINHPTRSLRTVIVLSETEEGAKQLAEHRTRIFKWRVDGYVNANATAFVHEYLS